ncbi:MAG: hypothetical protein JWR06_1982, partial [Jatrophihabitans sp.]|nr:hypothetical protein [Jatrophihabitans sp.]
HCELERTTRTTQAGLGGRRERNTIRCGHRLSTYLRRGTKKSFGAG